MSGDWHIVATIPNFLDRGVVGGVDVHAPTELIVHENLYIQRGGFDAKRQHLKANIYVLPHSGNADWRVQPFWPLRLPFQIYYVDPEYHYGLFRLKNRRWGWIYSRTSDIPEQDYRNLLERFRSIGYDPTRFQKLIQRPNQIGQPGFWSDGIRASRTTDQSGLDAR
jgi:apolipoprotein D and lipocalin family protein